LPPVPWCIDKELGRRAMKGELPEEVLARPKAPLLADPLEVCWQRQGWRPFIGKSPPKMMHEFVKWKSWLATLEHSKGYVPYEYIYPASLSQWLKAIEKKGGIQ
ncbi:MAG TPA: hypothetical protein VFI45_09390, partial [Candidatus Acidoferrum sp.]|nr:hypothetical protein [Candidatus Acidoferrum sp.]